MTFPRSRKSLRNRGCLHGRSVLSPRTRIFALERRIKVIRKEESDVKRKEARTKPRGRNRGISGGRYNERKRKTKRVSTYFVVDCGPRDRLCSQSGTPRSMLSVQGQRTGRAKTRVGTRIRRVHSIQR